MTELKIRPYQSADRAALRQIAADTAFFGEPIEGLMEDRELFLDYFYRYYTDFEPELAWVACDGDEVAGFLTGCADTRRHDALLRSKILPGLIGGILTGRYRIGRLTWKYAAGMARAALRRELIQADLTVYPAHLHINVAKLQRGRGLGRRLMEAYLNQLLEMEVSGVHLGTSSRNEAACRMYESMGFVLLGAVPTVLWRHAVGQPVEMRCYGLKLAAELRAG